MRLSMGESAAFWFNPKNSIIEMFIISQSLNHNPVSGIQTRLSQRVTDCLEIPNADAKDTWLNFFCELY